MRSSTLLTGALTTTLATAFPAPTPRTESSSKGFHLRINVLSPPYSPSSSPLSSIQNQYLSTLRTGAGSAISLISPSAPGSAFYLNGTAYHTTITLDIPPVYPLSLSIPPKDVSDPFYPGEHPISAYTTGGSELFLRAGEPILFPLKGDEGGRYAVCDREELIGGGRSRITTARYVYGEETVPDDCAEVEFVVECAQLADLPEGAGWNHDFAFEVPCVEA